MMGDNKFVWVIQLLILVQFLDSCLGLPLCVDSTAPFTANPPLNFCPYNETTCCNSSDDLRLQKQFQSMNVSDSACASLLKSIICARCDPFSFELFKPNSVSPNLPVLCNSTAASQSKQSTNNFCSQVWNTCQNVSISNSPFAASLQGQTTLKNSNTTTLTDVWQSQPDFCNALGASDASPCFNGSPITLNATTTPPNPPAGMCLEKIANGSYLNMAAHPDGSSRAFFANQAGKIWLATIPEQGSGQVLGLDEANPFLDLTDEVHFDTEFGMLGIAFHPKFAENGRFFASFSCDKAKWPACAGRCACNSDVDCDPSKLAPDNGANPCQFQSVIAEFTAGSSPSSATRADPTEVRRIFTMGLPFTSHHGGQILFGPGDGYLYLMMGDGGGVNDPYKFSQNKKSLLGKIMRFDIDNLPSAGDVNRLGLWGNYSIPKDNPHYTVDNELREEIWALGLRNPWRCSFDSARPSYFICSDTGQDLYEEVDLITKNGNYGWSVYEGTYANKLGGKNASILRPIFPVMGYNHSEINVNEGSASVTGGYLYRSMTDPCMHGKYLYADLYAGAIWAGSEHPENSGKFTSSNISFTCAHDSPLSCTFTGSSQLPSLSYIFSFGEDNKKDVYLLTNSGVYRVVRASRCNYACATEEPSTAAPPAPVGSGASVFKGQIEVLVSFLVLVFLSFV